MNCPAILQSCFIQLHTREGTHNVCLQKIIFCTSDNSLTTIHIEEMKPLIISKSLAHFERLLKNFGFARIHNKHLVNLTHVTCCRNSEDGFQVHLDDNTTLNVSRQMKKELMEAFKTISVTEEIASSAHFKYQ